MNLPKTLFWDSNIAAIDYEQHARSIIERVITRGTLADWKNEFFLYFFRKELLL